MKGTEERIFPRYEKDITLFIEVKSPSVMAHTDDCIVICNTLDLSETGAQVIIDESIPEGNIIRLCLQVAEYRPIFVVAKVVWRKKDTAAPDYHLGLNLVPSVGTDYQQWCSMVTALSSNVS